MKILITNIGNRNIKYMGKLHSDLEKNQDRPDTSLSFRKWTEQLLENFETEKENIELNILDTVLDQENLKPDKIFIFVSNQANNPNKNGQDTFYEGEIIKRIIAIGYQIEDVEIKEITDNVTDENYLMRYFQQFYTYLLKVYRDAFFIICDAGGTGQLKIALKIMAEFMLNDNQWKVVYPDRDGSIKDKPQIEYRNIINKEQAIALVRKSQYKAALTVLGGNVYKITDNKTFNLLSFAHFRSHRVLEQTKKIYEGGNNIENRRNIIIMSARYPKKRGFNENLFDLLGENNSLFLSETLLFSFHNYRINNFRESILDFAVFYEEFINQSLALIRRKVEKLIGKQSTHNDNVINRWIKNDISNCPDTQKYAIDKCKESPYNYETVPLSIHLIAEQGFFPQLHSIANELLPFLDFTYSPYKQEKQNSVREMRNKIAHEGIYIEQTTLNTELPYYGTLLSKCLETCGLPQDDVYEQLNTLIEDQIRGL